MKKTKKIKDVEQVHFNIEKGAFDPSNITCSQCTKQMKKAEIEINIEGSIFIKVFGFECASCNKRYLGLEEAQKLDKAMILSRFVKNDFKMERSLSFDGDNWTMRIPKEFSRDVKKRKVEIMPLGAKQFCATIE